MIQRKEISILILIIVFAFAGCGIERHGQVPGEVNGELSAEVSGTVVEGQGEEIETEVVDDEGWESAPLLTVDNPENENLADLLQKAASNTMVQICVGEVTGSGVLWQVLDGKLYIATAGHVFENIGKENGEDLIEIHFVDGETATTSEYWKSENADLAFVCVDCTDWSWERIQHYCLVNTDKESFDELETGDGIILMASANGVGKDAYEGSLVDRWIYMEDFGQYMMYIRVYAYAGMSGGGVFDGKGHFIGIFCGESNETDGAAVPLNIIQTEYMKLLDKM